MAYILGDGNFLRLKNWKASVNISFFHRTRALKLMMLLFVRAKSGVGVVEQVLGVLWRRKQGAAEPREWGTFWCLE